MIERSLFSKSRIKKTSIRNIFIVQKLLLDTADTIPVSTVSPNRILADGYSRLVADEPGVPIKVAF
jgi:hypothetical protein